MTDNLDALSAAASPSQFLTRDQRAVADAMHEGIPGFEDALASGVAFMNYISLWSGGGAVPVSALDQQERLGIAKSFAVATDHLDAAVREAVAKEREACAGVADGAFLYGLMGEWDKGYNHGASDVAQRIRARDDEQAHD